MKKIYLLWSLWMMLIIPFSISIQAQNPTYLCELRNDGQTSSTVFEFDIYLLRTGSNVFEYAAGQYGILVNPSVRNGGTITASIVAGSSDAALAATNQNPISISYLSASNCVAVAGRALPGAGNGAIISNITPGTRVCRVRLTNTIPFGQFQPNLTWTTSATYPTQIYAYVGGSNVSIMDPASQTTNNLANKIMNQAPAVFNVTGGGSYCQGSPGLSVNLSGSEVGVTYALIKDGSPTGSTLPGTGSPITFTNQLSGTYTMSGTNGGGTTPMTGSALITEITRPTITGTAPASRCGTGSVTLGATASAGTINWYAAPTGGPSLGTGTSYTTPSISVTTTYWVDATSGSCTTASRTSVTATVNTVPTISSVTPGSVCGSGTVTLGATASAGTINWYAAPTGGPSLGTGTSFTTPSISTTTTYYVDATNGGCTTASRTSVTATVNTIPTIVTTTPASRCGTGSVTLGATASAGTINWYAAPTGGPSLGTGTSYTTPGISSTTTYWVDATNSGCTTASRTSVTATVNAIPTITGTIPGSRCGTGTVTLGATASAGTINWYAAPTGGPSLGTGTSFTTPSISITTTYYVDATNSGCTTASRTPVVATVGAILTPTMSGLSTVCAGTAGVVYTTDAGQTNYIWTISAGGTITADGTTSNTATVTWNNAGAQSISVTYTPSGGCTANVTTYPVTVNAIPSITSTTPATRCGTGTVILSATASAGTINWYADPTGGLSLFTGASFTTPSLLTSTTYYVDATSGGCTTASRIGVTAIVNPLPTANAGPALSAICQNGTSSPLGGIIGGSATTGTWSTLAGGTFNPSPTTLDATWTPLAGYTGSATLTLTASGGSCGTATASKIQVVNPLPTVLPIGGGALSVCVNSTTPAFTDATAGGTWSIVPGTGTASITVGGIVTGLTAGTVTVTYTVTNICGSASATQLLTVNALPAIPTITASGPTIFCTGGSVILTASAGTSYLWSTGATTASITITTAGSYTVQVTNAGGCLSAASLPTLVTVNALPATPTITASGPTAICAGSTLTLTSSTGTTYLWSTGAITPSINVTTAGSYTVRITNINGCQSAASLATVVTVNPIPTPTISSSDPDNFICQGSSVTFTATGGTIYSFRVAGTIVQTGATATYTTSALLNGQVVDVIAFNAIGCSATSTGITNFINQLPVFYLSTSPTCSPDYSTYSLGVTVVGSGTVTSTSGVVTNTGSNVWTITGVLKGVNVTVRVTDVNLCESVLVVTAPNCDCPIIAAPVSGGDRSYCELGVIPTINATVLAGETIDWYNSSSGGTLLRANSLSYTPAAAGTYYALARNIASGCVSSTRTAIRVIMNTLPIPSLTSSDADNIICSGASVTFTAGGGTSYNFRVAGASVQNGPTATYTTSSLTNNQLVDVIVTNANGCIATSASITNTVNAVPIPTLTSSDADNRFCAGTSVTFTAGGGTSYSFRVGGIGVQTGASATYTTSSLTDNQVVDVIVTNASGCSATSAGITNTVFSSLTTTLTSSDADNIFCSGTSVTFTATGGATYNFRVGGVSVQNSTSATYTTSSLTNGQTVDVIASNASGCTAISTAITNVVNPSPTANAGAGGDECDLDFIFKAVASIGTGTWTLTSGPGTVIYTPDANSATATATVSDYGTYTFTWTEISGSCSKSTTVTVNFYQQPVASAGTGGNNCGLEFNLNGTLNIGTGTWSKVSGPGDVTFAPDANSATASVTVTKFGSYVFRWSVVNGTCSNSTTVSVNFIQQTAANAGSGGSECDKDFIFNAVAITGTGTWTKVSGPGNAVFSPDNHQPNAKVTVDQFGTYRFAWTVVNISCTSSDIIEVVYHNLPSINAGLDKELCKGGSIQLNAQGVGTFAWSPASVLNNPAINNPIATPATTTTFTVVLTDQYGCKNSDGVLVEVREKPVANAGPDQVLEYLFETTMDAILAYPYETGVWSVVTGTGRFEDKKLPRTMVDSLSVGVNKFLWTVANKVCPSSSDSVRIEVHDFAIPSLITPNMDGINDYFVLRGLTTLGRTELIIFDRRGAQVYKNSNYDNLWNGVDYNENPLPEDTYYYVLKSENGKSLSGYIVIRR